MEKHTGGNMIDIWLGEILYLLLQEATVWVSTIIITENSGMASGSTSLYVKALTLWEKRRNNWSVLITNENLDNTYVYSCSIWCMFSFRCELTETAHNVEIELDMLFFS